MHSGQGRVNIVAAGQPHANGIAHPSSMPVIAELRLPLSGVNNQTARQVLAHFEQWICRASLKCSTQKIYLCRLRRFTRYVTQQIQIEGREFSAHEMSVLVSEFLAKAKVNRSATASTINNFVTLFRILSKVEGLTILDLEREMQEGKKRLSFTDEQQSQYLQAISGNRSVRDRLLALIFLRTRIRLGECTNIKLTDLIRQNNQLQIRVHGRSGPRFEPVCADLEEAINYWLLELEGVRFVCKSEYLFCGPFGDKLSKSAVEQALRKSGWKVGLNVCARILRNTYLEQKVSAR